jgi:hypothetical protein
MCLGNQKQVKDTVSNVQLPQWLTSASQNNVASAQNLRDTGYQEYTGPRVAELTPDQNAAYSTIRSMASSENPYKSDLENVFGSVAKAGPQSVSTVRSIDNVPGQGASGSTQDYMNPFIGATLDPIMRQIARQRAAAQNQSDAVSTMGGAFGDARHGFADAEVARNFNNAETDAVGKVNSDAYDRAMQQKQADIARLLDVGKTNANLTEQGMQRQLQGGTALQNLDKYDTGRQADLANMEAAAGEKQRSVNQAGIDAKFQEFMRSQNWPIQLQQLVNQAIASAPHDVNKDEKVYQPDNSGFGMLGSALGAIGSVALAPATGGVSLAGLGKLSSGIGSNATNSDFANMSPSGFSGY